MIEVYSDREDGYEPFYTPFCDCCGCWLESQYSFGAAQHGITARPTASQDFAGLGGSKL